MKENKNVANVAVVSCASYSREDADQAMDEALRLTDGLDWVKSGMKIAVKVNLVSGMAPEKAATTHPQLVCSLCRLLVERGAEVIVGDSPGGIYTAGYVNGIYKATGMTMVEKTGAKLNQDFSVENAVFPEAASIKTFAYTGWLKDMDAVISFSKLKTHAMMAMSCSVKNLFGTIPGTTKPEYHMRFPDKRAFANLMVDLNEYFKPTLCLVDGVLGMEGNGPTAGTPKLANVLLCSKDPYSLDMACADLMGLQREDVPTLQEAYLRSLGPESILQVDRVGSAAGQHTPFELVTRGQSITFDNGSMLGKVRSRAMRLALSTRPQVKKKECIGCRKCENICPAKAITMVKDKPVVDRSKCIHCFCCQEFCPKGAMKVHHNLAGRIVQLVNTKKAT